MWCARPFYRSTERKCAHLYKMEKFVSLKNRKLDCVWFGCMEQDNKFSKYRIHKANAISKKETTGKSLTDKFQVEHKNTSKADRRKKFNFRGFRYIVGCFTVVVHRQQCTLFEICAVKLLQTIDGVEATETARKVVHNSHKIKSACFGFYVYYSRSFTLIFFYQQSLYLNHLRSRNKKQIHPSITFCENSKHLNCNDTYSHTIIRSIKINDCFTLKMWFSCYFRCNDNNVIHDQTARKLIENVK